MQFSTLRADPSQDRIRLLSFHGVHLVSGLSGSREILGDFIDYRESSELAQQQGSAP